MSDDIELNVDTLEPDEEEIEKKVCEEECGEQRVPMRKPATLVQYWVNTGNQPYNALLDEDELSETGASLSEKEVILSLSSMLTVINEGNKQNYKNESSYSSVNTAAYILSNTYITNKADTIAIRQSAKCGKNTNSSKNICIKDVKEKVTPDDKTQCVQNENAKVNCVTDNDNVNTNVSDSELYSISKEYVASKICDQPITNIATSGNTIETNTYLQNYEQIDKMSVLNISQGNLDAQITDDVQQFGKTSKRLIGNDENSALNQNKMLEKDISYEERESENHIIAQEVIAKNKNLTTFYRKKLYTGRNSPIDLIQTERHSINRLSGTRQSLHPALDSDCMMKRKTFLVHEGKNKNLSPFDNTTLGHKKTKRRRRKHSCISYKNNDINNELSNNNGIKNFDSFSNELPNKNGIKNFNNSIDSSFKISSDPNNSDKRDDILLSECNNANIFVRNETCKQDLVSLNINPVVLLERIIPFEQYKSKFVDNNHIKRNNVHNYRYLNNKLHTCKVESVELEAIDSDESTILVCQCKTNTQHSSSFSKDSDCSFNLKLSTDFSASNIEEKYDKLSSLENIDLSQNKSYTIEELSPCLSVNEECTNVRSREIKVMVEQLPSPTMKSQISNKDDIVWEKNVLNESKILSTNSHEANKIGNVKSREIKVIIERLPESVNKNSINTTMKAEIVNKNDIQEKEILDKFKTHSSNSYRINKTDNVKLREIKIVLERLPPDIYFNDTNIFVHGNKISKNGNLHNNKREHRIQKTSETSCKNIEATTQTIDKVGYSLRMHTKSMKYNNPRIGDTSNVAEHQVSDKEEFSNQYKNDNLNNKVNQSDHSKHSILTFMSSDEDDFVQLIQHPKKKLKFSINDKMLSETNIIENNLCNKDEYYCNRNVKTIIFSSKEPKREEFESINDRNGSSEIKSFNNTTNTFLKMSKNRKFLYTSNKNNNVTKNLDKQKERASSINYNINNSNERHSNTIVEKNGGNYKDDTCDIFFQTKRFYSDSSDCEEDNSYTTSTRKTIKNSFVHHKSRYKHANFKKFSNDSIGKRYNKRQSSSTNSFEKHDVANRIHDVQIDLESIGKETKISKRLDNEEFNDNINSTINNTKKNISYFINDTSIRDTTMQKKLLSNISFGKNNFSSLSKNKQISDKSKNSAAIQQDNVNSTKLLIFQTKTYYDSDSSESL